MWGRGRGRRLLPPALALGGAGFLPPAALLPRLGRPAADQPHATRRVLEYIFRRIGEIEMTTHAEVVRKPEDQQRALVRRRLVDHTLPEIARLDDLWLDVDVHLLGYRRRALERARGGRRLGRHLRVHRQLARHFDAIQDEEACLLHLRECAAQRDQLSIKLLAADGDEDAALGL